MRRSWISPSPPVTGPSNCAPACLSGSEAQSGALARSEAAMALALWDSLEGECRSEELVVLAQHQLW